MSPGNDRVRRPGDLGSTERVLPKTEIHLHLEGAIPLPALWELLEKYGGDAGIGSMAELEARFRYESFPRFIETWNWKNGFLREYDDFSFVASALAEDLRRQNIRYVEAFFSPSDFADQGLEVQRITEAVRRGLDEQAGEPEVRLIADVVRDYGPERAQRTLREIAEVKDLGVIGIGMGGSEQSYPPEPFAEVYEQARSHGLRTTVHAGEAAGPESVWGALKALRPDRIGHGTRAVDDPALVAFLKDRQIPVEMCPISNLRTGVVGSIAAHPIRRFFDAGLLVSVNTDDPKMFQTSLAEELTVLGEELRFTPPEIVRLLGNGIRSSWCDHSTQDRLLVELAAAAAS